MQSTRQVFENLVGVWSIKRVLGNFGTAEGTAKFTLQNQNKTETTSNSMESGTSDVPSNAIVINYREDLKVKYDNNTLSGPQLGSNVENTAYKEYVYMYDKARDKIMKKFTNGNLFYELSIDFENQTANGDHLCEKDFYKATYNFANLENFVLTYYVDGPKKDYLIETEFTKQVTE